MKICREFKCYIVLASTLCLFSLNATDAYAAKEPIVGTIIAKTDQIIFGETISSLTGPCIIIPENVKNVRIQQNQIGPCGTTVDDVGIRIDRAAHHVYIGGNTIHDASTAIYAAHADHPITIEKNTVYDIRGPLPMGQMVQFYDVGGKGFKSKIFGNISDKNLSKNPTAYEDHISIRKSYGTEDNPIVIACNKIRGGDLPTGSGITVGKDGGEWIIIRDNIIVMTPNTGIAIAGADRVRVFRNMIWNRGDNKESHTDYALSVFTYAENSPKYIEISRNQAIANSWITEGDGSVSKGLYDDKTARVISYFSNDWRYGFLKENIWITSREDCSRDP